MGTVQPELRASVDSPVSWIDAFLTTYSTVQVAGTALTSRPTLNLSTGLTGSDDAANNRTVISTSYTAASSANWNGTPPTSIANALDRIAAHSGPIP